jgi:hypothetical protein
MLSSMTQRSPDVKVVEDELKLSRPKSEVQVKEQQRANRPSFRRGAKHLAPTMRRT